MRVYTASRFSEYERVRRFNDDLREAGHIVTHDWTRTEEFGPDGHPLNGNGSLLPLGEQARHAQEDLDAAGEADVVILLPVPDMGGAYVEVGYALARGKRIIVAGEGRFLIFWSLPAVTMLPDEAAARELFGMREVFA
jgi:hypothetical protein